MESAVCFVEYEHWKENDDDDDGALGSEADDNEVDSGDNGEDESGQDEEQGQQEVNLFL